MIFAGNFK
uniref:Uncharacterized protein n=1 Tax=Rhizophora mucronata TaxID=61149 RepID=A0A2P2IHJ0_RHIMU